MNMKKRWDVIVIGGGPAGSTAARYAAEKQISVLVIDGKKEIGEPLQCGELIPSIGELRRLCPDVPEMDDLFQTPEHAISLRTEKLKLVPPSGKGLDFPFEGIMLNRPEHDKALIKLAKSKGVEYLTNTHISKVEGNNVHTRNGDVYYAKVILGCGGTNDPIRRDFWDEKSLNIPVKFMLIDGDYDESTVELHFGSSAPGGYAWVFPKKNGANIGLGIQKRYAKGVSLNVFAKKFYSKFKGNVVFHGAGSLPMSGSVKSLVKDNKLIVGDAAGMVLPSNGAGITTSMIGARIAGQVVAEHLLKGVPLIEYERIWNVQMGKIMRNSKRSLLMGSMLFRSPDFFVNMAFNKLTKSLLWRAVTCRAKFGII
jgi:digeranylgeranylglycerophospholipid reductase